MYESGEYIPQSRFLKEINHEKTAIHYVDLIQSKETTIQVMYSCDGQARFASINLTMDDIECLQDEASKEALPTAQKNITAIRRGLSEGLKDKMREIRQSLAS